MAIDQTAARHSETIGVVALVASPGGWPGLARRWVDGSDRFLVGGAGALRRGKAFQKPHLAPSPWGIV